MLFTNAGVSPGATVLVQGAGWWGGHRSRAARQRGRAADVGDEPGCRQGAAALAALGAEAAFGSGERLPERVDAVMETVGAATWSHSVNALRPGGTIVISGATSGDAPAKAELTKIFFGQPVVVGSTMGSREELERLAAFVAGARIEPVIDSVRPLVQAREGFAAMAQGHVGGKIVFTLGVSSPRATPASRCAGPGQAISP